MLDWISILGFVGVIVTSYAIYVEKYALTQNFRAICDINSKASCSVVLTSRYARLAKLWLKLPNDSKFNLPNTYYGLLFYIAVILYPIYPFTLVPFREVLLLIAAIMSVMMCVVLGWILYYKLKNFCAVCVTTYIINMSILIISVFEIHNKYFLNTQDEKLMQFIGNYHDYN